MKARRRAKYLRLSAVLALGLLAGCQDRPPAGDGVRPPATEGNGPVAGRQAGRHGGRLVVALRAEPRTFNPVFAIDNPSQTIIRRTTADLVHINRHSQQTEPALAESWTAAPDGRGFRVELRRGVRFSDGHPLDADDVLFTFMVYGDEEIASPYSELLRVAGEPIVVRKLGPYTLSFELPRPYAAADRLFDSIAILPRHRLATLYQEGSLATAWGLSAPLEEIVGLGPFRLRRYVPGERLELERNPHFWETDAEGRRLPYLDEIIFLFVAGADAQAIRFQAGETDLVSALTPDNFTLLERQARHRGDVLADLGAGMSYQFLFFNLNDLDRRQLPAIEAKQTWFRNVAFRRAVSSAIDRESIVRLVYQGRASALASHVTPGDKLWLNRRLQPPNRDLEAARRYLGSAGFRWDGDGRLRDPDGAPVELTIAVNAGNSEQVQMVTMIQDDLRVIGMPVHAAALEFRALLDRVLNTYDYQACLLGINNSDADPNAAMNVLPSSGESHLWRLAQTTPAAPWQEEIDLLMRQQLVTLDYRQRKQLYDRTQKLVAENLPFIALVSPNVLVGARGDLAGFTPAINRHTTLWNVEELFWRSRAGR